MNTIQSLQQKFLKKEISSQELTQHYFEKIKQSDHNAYLTLCEERALKQAVAADQLLAKGSSEIFEHYPLLGIPLGIKDVLNIEGVRTTCGSKMLEQYISPYTSTCVERLENAGAISLGKLNMDEFAMGGSNENSAYGYVKHPTHEGYVPGGSSGGSATAVKADLCVAALGTDTGGSVRLPASFTGIVGYKPTYGTFSRYGLVAFASSLDQVGPMTKNVEDTAILTQVMAGYDPKDSTSSKQDVGNILKSVRTAGSLKGLRIGVPKDYLVDGISPEVLSAVEKSYQLLEQQGATLVPIHLPHTKYSVAVYYIIAVSEASSNLSRFDGIRFGKRPADIDTAKDLAEFYKKVRAQFGPEVKRRIMLGTFALSSGYYDAYFTKACKVRRLIAQDFSEAFKTCDVIAAPVSPSTAYKVGEKAANPLKMYLNDIFTIPVNLAGLPGISLPCGQDSQGLPIGLHMIAPQFKDSLLLQTAAQFETLAKGVLT